MIPAALAVGELTGASGADVLAAYALGLEIAGKVGRALGHGHSWRLAFDRDNPRNVIDGGRGTPV